jgi:hypothetical protein
MGRGQKAIRTGFIDRTCWKEAETKRGWTKGDHRGHEAALGGVKEGASPVVAQIRLAKPDIA